MKNIETILGSEVLSEEVKASINEAWDAKVAIVREQLTAELREEFSGRYGNGKTQIGE